jgi:hypothetical protein
VVKRIQLSAERGDVHSPGRRSTLRPAAAPATR